MNRSRTSSVTGRVARLVAGTTLVLGLAVSATAADQAQAAHPATSGHRGDVVAGGFEWTTLHRV